MEKDYYKVLGVPSDANEGTIKKAYRDLAKKYHPDVDPSPEAEEKMKQASVAYATLSDPKQRREYDLSNAKSMGTIFDDKETIFDDKGTIFGWRRGDKKAKSSQNSKPDFSEIEKLDNKIKEYDEVLKNVTQEISDYNIKITDQRKLIEDEIQQIRNTKSKEENYIKAMKYIEKFRRKDSIRFINLTITQKQYDIYRDCVEILEQIEKQIKALEESLKKEKIEPLEKMKDKKEAEYWQIFNEKHEVRKAYNDHSLRYEYAKEKQKQEAEASKKK